MHLKLRRRLSPSTLRRHRIIVALALGFTAIPAVALAATDAVPGDPFKLGQDNTIAATTTLTGTNQAPGQGADGVLRIRKTGGLFGPAINIENSAPGASQPGLNITTRPGQVPIKVSPDAGKASFLNADKLDGRDHEDFLPTQLYGDGSRLIEGSGGGKRVLIPLRCDPEDIALNAGGNARGAEDHINSITPFRSSYHVEFTDNDNPSLFSANIICMDSGSPHRPESS
jgi:hypothetical protein